METEVLEIKRYYAYRCFENSVRWEIPKPVKSECRNKVRISPTNTGVCLQTVGLSNSLNQRLKTDVDAEMSL